MKDTAMYEHLLGIKTPWSVKRMDLSMADQRVTVEVVLKKGQIWADPTNDRARAHINGWREREWRRLDTCQFENIIKARVPQLKYSDGTVEELTMPWAERYARVSTLMETFVLKLLEACQNTKKVCSLTRLPWHTVNAILVKGMERGHSYASILTDLDRSRVLDVVPCRKLESATELLHTLSPEQRLGVKAVAMDMWPAFMGAARNCLPQADVMHDRFHVSKYLNDAVNAVNTVRRREHRTLLKAGSSPLTGSKYAWMKTYADGRSSEAVSFRPLNQLNPKTSRGWRIKESFSQFWFYRQTAAARRYFKSWGNHAMRSKLEPVKKVVKMLRRHEQGLLNYSVHRITNACVEGFNSAIQLIKANARGFRNFTNYRARILFHCGKLEMGLG
ncbi:MAG: ISL3 family transposase [Candidatus Saccharibacteria bacterium]|nr:ISL3 family transposase [Rhodoferax sp.]